MAICLGHRLEPHARSGCFAFKPYRTSVLIRHSGSEDPRGPQTFWAVSVNNVSSGKQLSLTGATLHPSPRVT